MYVCSSIHHTGIPWCCTANNQPNFQPPSDPGSGKRFTYHLSATITAGLRAVIPLGRREAIRDRYCLGVGLHVIYVEGSSTANAQSTSASLGNSRRRGRYRGGERVRQETEQRKPPAEDRAEVASLSSCAGFLPSRSAVTDSPISFFVFFLLIMINRNAQYQLFWWPTQLACYIVLGYNQQLVGCTELCQLFSTECVTVPSLVIYPFTTVDLLGHLPTKITKISKHYCYVFQNGIV